MTVNAHPAIGQWERAKPDKNHHLQERALLYHRVIHMPQFGRDRKVWACLPSNYFVSDERYPVIYMQDAQNLFDQISSPFGEWGLDRAMADIEAELGFRAIIVAPNHGDALRLPEFSPYPNRRLGGGEGELFARFVVETLKPAIDREFRTLPDRQHTAIGGSSMGGLISFYIGIRHSDVFAKVGVFSPSFWFSEEKIFEFAERAEVMLPMKMYMLAGMNEGKTMVPSVERMKYILSEKGLGKRALNLVIKKDGYHSEVFWRNAYPVACRWMFDLPELPLETMR